jgi:chromosome segregation ATPase
MSQPVSRTRQVLAEQDATLSLIEQGVANLHEASLAINAELNTQNGLLEDLNQSVDTTRDRMDNQGRRVNELRTKPTSWRLWLFVVIATAALLFLILY